jgi:dihydrofolate synthase/folylpolyglutamate synthase
LIKVGEDLTWRKGPAGLEGQGIEVRGRLGSYDLWTPLLGEHQLENVTVAVGALEVLKEQGFDLSGQALYDGISQVRWPCRMEVLKTSPLVVCDGAHNPYSAARLRESVPGYFKYNRAILIVGANRDHSLEGIVHELIPLGLRVIATRSRHPKAARTDTVAGAFRSQGPASLVIDEVENVGDAVSKALEEAGDDDLVLATGSLFVAAEVREAILGIEPELYPDLKRRT